MTENQAFKELSKMIEDADKKADKLINLAQNKRLKNRHLKSFVDNDFSFIGGRFNDYMVREKFIPAVGFALFTEEFIRFLEEKFQGKTVLEVCAGKGYLASRMESRDLTWIATDNFDPSWKEFWRDPYTKIQNYDALQAVKDIKADIIFASWIPYGSTLDLEIAQNLKNNQEFYFISEGEGGCTGSDEIWEQFDIQHVKSPLTQWHGIHDGLWRVAGSEV